MRPPPPTSSTRPSALGTTGKRCALLALCISSLALYPLLNTTRDPVVIKTPLDDLIPVMPSFVVPYLLFFPYLLATLGYFLLVSKQFQAFATSFLICSLGASVVFFFVQTEGTQLSLLGGDLCSVWVTYVHQTDGMYNCFPSTHVAFSFLSFRFWASALPAVRIPVGLLTGAIIASTVLIKQHYLPDVAGGLAIAAVSYFIATRTRRAPPGAMRPTPARPATLLIERRRVARQAG